MPSSLKAQDGLTGKCPQTPLGTDYDEQIYGEEIGEKEKQNGSHVVERNRKEETKAVRSGLKWKF